MEGTSRSGSVAVDVPGLVVAGGGSKAAVSGVGPGVSASPSASNSTTVNIPGWKAGANNTSGGFVGIR